MALSFKKWRATKVTTTHPGLKLASTNKKIIPNKNDRNSNQDKLEIENYLNKIRQLLKAPKNASKAAMIISEMLTSKIK